MLPSSWGTDKPNNTEHAMPMDFLFLIQLWLITYFAKALEVRFELRGTWRLSIQKVIVHHLSTEKTIEMFSLISNKYLFIPRKLNVSF